MTGSLTNLVDLAVSRNGGRVEEASDDFFAPKERLILAEEPVYEPGLYTQTGKWMDGWESRRKRTPGNDWCIVRLAWRGRIRAIDIDTRHFVGNHPEKASVDVADNLLGETDAGKWTSLLGPSPLQPDAHNLFDISGDRRATHVRLNIFPDGGVARLRVYGDVEPDLTLIGADEVIEVSALSFGGVPISCSDEHFGRMMNLLRTDRPINMADGWETRRRRGPGHDWVIIRLGSASILDRIEVDTSFFIGNYPDRCSVDGALVRAESQSIREDEWIRIAGETKLDADRLQTFDSLADRGPFTHLRLNVYPDGGVARFRAFGRLADTQ